MLRLCYLLILTLFLLTSCVRHNSPPVRNHSVKSPVHNKQKIIDATMGQQYRKVQSFNQVRVSGRINVNLHTGYKKPQLLLKGAATDLAQVQTRVHNHTLYLSLGSGYPQHGQVSVHVMSRYLNQIYYEGAGVVVGNKLNSRLLDLYLANEGTTRLNGTLGINNLTVKGNGLVQISGITSYNMKVRLIGAPKVQLTGMVNLSDLDIKGNGWLSLYWVKSKNLTIRGKSAARIQLAGAVNRLDVELWGAAQFKGRFLRAQRSFIKTHDKALAEISSVNHQSSLASDASDIYYYNIPNTRGDYMADSGSVLDMRDLSSPFIDEDYTRYNKHFP